MIIIGALLMSGHINAKVFFLIINNFQKISQIYLNLYFLLKKVFRQNVATIYNWFPAVSARVLSCQNSVLRVA